MELHKGLTRRGCCKGDSQLGPVEGVGFQWYPYEHPDEASRKLQVGGVPVYPGTVSISQLWKFGKSSSTQKYRAVYKRYGGYWIVLRRVSCLVGWSSSPRSWAPYLWTISAWFGKTGKAGSCWVACDRWILKRGWAGKWPLHECCMNVATTSQIIYWLWCFEKEELRISLSLVEFFPAANTMDHDLSIAQLFDCIFAPNPVKIHMRANTFLNTFVLNSFVLANPH